MMSSSAIAQGPLPILRGIVLLPSGEGRAYFEDPLTGVLGGYGLRDTVGGSKIEQIREDRVVLRRESGLVQILLSAQSPAGTPSPQLTVTAPAAPRPSTDQPSPAAGPIIGNGQPWLDKLGVPPQAFARAIEQAFPVEESNNLSE